MYESTKAVLGNKTILALLLADDMAVVAKTARELQILIDQMAEYLESKKLRLNLRKTEIMIFNKGGRRNLVENEKFRFKGQEVKNYWRKDGPQPFKTILALLLTDDMAVVAKTARELQILIDQMAEYLESKKLRLNLRKTEIIIFNKGGRRNLVENEKFWFKGQEVKVVEKAKYLEFTLTPNCSWKEHLSKMSKLAKAAVGAILLRSECDEVNEVNRKLMRNECGNDESGAGNGIGNTGLIGAPGPLGLTIRANIENETEGRLKCVVVGCGRSIISASGLGQQMWHQHPVLYNEIFVRLKRAQRKDDNLRCVTHMEMEHGDLVNINQCIVSRVTGRTD
ncbi:hypothetical protein QYM36_010965 [Artemia franciscana]|uniref:Reverse transcriptase domain-containing protein n=1 Tax=Artemia franciscana TaxID=6661 RepID=A0AA88HWC7_ARTSF|nr:hypothetical protein QYM36_010965 [Artemia franciscana]